MVYVKAKRNLSIEMEWEGQQGLKCNISKRAEIKKILLFLVVGGDW